MTIILSTWDGKNPIHLLSDVLLSAEGDLERSITLPHLPLNTRLQAGGSTLVGLAQKTIIFGSTTCLWAGRAVVAQTIIKELFARSKGGTRYVALSELIQGLDLLEEEKSDVGLLTFFCDRPNNVVTCGHGIYNYDVSLGDGTVGRIATVGSGFWDFLENYQASRRKPIDYSLPIDMIHRMATRTIEPFLNSNESFDFLYGSWFELSIHSEQTFRKLPIAFKFWYRPARDAPFQRNGPLVYSNYFEDDLFITTVVTTSAAALSRTIQIPDFLGRARPSDVSSSGIPDEALLFHPELFIHVLLTGHGGGKAKARLAPFFVDGDPLVTVTKQSSLEGNLVDVAIHSSLEDFINGLDDEVDLDVDPRPFS